MAATPKIRFISFYSYKGGTGRTLALANCARALAQLGKTVAVIDLDLEAPGLAHFAAFRPKGEKAVGKDRPLPELAGFADYIDVCLRDGPPARLAGYFHPCKGAKGDRGRVFLMPAGKRDGPAYRDILSFDWDGFYAEKDGYRIMENLRGHIAHNLGEDDQRPIRPDYVLIDSRTGLSETGGIATHQLADLVVLIFGLNRQNLDGTAWVHDSLAALRDPPRMLLVVSPLPEILETGKGTLFAERLAFIRKRLRQALNLQRPAILPYRPVLAWEERILVDSDEAEYLGYDQPYRELLTLILETFQDRDFYLDRAMDALRANDKRKARRELDAGLLANPDDPALLEALARLGGDRGPRIRALTTSVRRLWREKLDFLVAQEAVLADPGQLFALQQQIAECRAKLAELDEDEQRHRDRAPARIDLHHLPAGAEHFLGRGPELAALDAAWAPGSGIAVVELIAPGGTGKTALVKRWLDGLKARGWGGADQVYGWSFYSQGTGDDRQASEDHFLASAIKRLGIEIAPSANPADKGQGLADRLCASRTLLILDGMEPLQYPPGPLAGELRAPGIKALLAQLTAAGHPGLCVVTSREWLQDLGEWVRNETNPQGCVLRLDLGNLSDTDGAALLHARGATRAGAAEIRSDDRELMAAAQELDGHALALSLLGRYLAHAKGGDIRQRDAVDPARADRDARGRAARMVAAYETWFAREGETSSRELAALRLIGFFNRPATPDLLEALRAAPPIAGLTEPLQGLSGDKWTIALAHLADCGLIQPDPRTGTLDAHPLVREFLAEALAERFPDAWREGHRRIYERLKASVPHRPEGLDGLQPLYQAVAHGCRAGLWQEVCDRVYFDRILRGTGDDGFYSIKNLGAFGADLGAVTCLFSEPWSRPAPALAAGNQAWLLNIAAFCLRALGRLGEALEPMRAGTEMQAEQDDWKNAAASYGNLSEIQLILGRVFDAVEDAERSVGLADRSGDAFLRLGLRTTLADALHQRGETEEARRRFAEAEVMQAEFQPQYPLLYSLSGFRHCDLLLARAERAAWGGGTAEVLEVCGAVAQRARQTLEWVEGQKWLLDIALDHLTLARCALYADQIQRRPPGAEAQSQAEQAVNGIRSAGRQDCLPLGLLTRAWLRHALGDSDGTQSDLAEAERIASRGAMQLHLADCALHRARLFQDRAALAEARRLIEQCGYGRRLPELADAQVAAAAWSA
jgi:tetratricopeptide (TPR) repeat protein